MTDDSPMIYQKIIRGEASLLPCMPEISAEVFIDSLEEGQYLVYAPLRRVAFVANSKIVNFLADLANGNCDFSVERVSTLINFLQQLGIVDGDSEMPPIDVIDGDPLPTMVTLFLTTACNLRCTYCYASAGELPIRMMSLETAKRGIDFVSSNALKRRGSTFQVGYHGGGEPTANWGVMTSSLVYARERADQLGLSVNISAATNAVLRDEQIRWIISNLDGLTVSFDGLPEINDANRVTALGKGSSPRIISTLKQLDSAHFPYGIRVTVTREHIPYLADSVEFISANFKPELIQVEPAYQVGRWTGAPSAETQEFIDAFREAQLRAKIFDMQISYSAARVDTLTNHFCGVSQDAFSLSPDGNVSGCYEVFSEDNSLSNMFFYGKPDPQTNGYQWDSSVLGNLRKQAVQHKPFCKGCFAKWHCAGDCYHRSLAVDGDGEFVGSERCHITRELTKDQILEKIRSSGGMVWREPLGDPFDQSGLCEGAEVSQ